MKHSSSNFDEDHHIFATHFCEDIKTSKCFGTCLGRTLQWNQGSRHTADMTTAVTYFGRITVQCYDSNGYKTDETLQQLVRTEHSPHGHSCFVDFPQLDDEQQNCFGQVRTRGAGVWQAHSPLSSMFVFLCWQLHKKLLKLVKKDKVGFEPCI